jgi:hypothetical protein
MQRRSLEHAVEVLSLHSPTAQRSAYVALEAFSVRLEVFSSLLVQRVRRVRLEEEELYPVSIPSLDPIAPANMIYL